MKGVWLKKQAAVVRAATYKALVDQCFILIRPLYSQELMARIGTMAMKNSGLSNFRVAITTSGTKMTAVNILLHSIIFHHFFRQSGDHVSGSY